MRKQNRFFLFLFFCGVFLTCIPSKCLGGISDSHAGKLIHVARKCLEEGNIECVIKATSYVISQRPECTECYKLRAKSWVLNKNLIEAIKDYTEILKRTKMSYPHVYYLRGDCFAELGLYKQAIKDYSICLRLMPKDGKVWYYRARTYALDGQLSHALKDIQKGLATGTHHANKLIKLRDAIIQGKEIPYHAPTSN